jgi:hypothetical protein
MRERIVAGVRLGAAFAAAFSAIAAIVFAVSGGRAVSRVEWGLFGVLAAYWSGGLLTGALGGALSPYARTNARAYLIGIICSSPTFAAIGIASGDSPFSRAGTVGIAVSSLTLGGICGVIVREIFGDDEPTASPDSDEE